MVTLAHRPLKTEAHDLTKHAVEVVRHLTGKEPTILGEEFTPRLEIIGHVKCASSAVPPRMSDSMISNRVEEILSPLSLRFELDCDGRPVQQAVW